MNDGNTFKEASTLMAQKELSSKIIELISEYAHVKPDEAQSFLKALISNERSDIDFTNALSVLVRKTNIPFHELSKKVMEYPKP